MILTAARSGEGRFAKFDEIDAEIWTLSADRTKTGKEHRIPLSREAQELLRAVRKADKQALLFPTSRGNPLSDAAMSRFLERERYKARPHGVRATFRTWVEEQTDVPFEVKEAALGHNVDSDVVRAYQRSDRLEKRRLLMDKWSNFLTGR